MNNSTTIVAYKETVLRHLEEKLDRKGFCSLHGYSKGHLSKVLRRLVGCEDELFDYLCQYHGIGTFAEWHRLP